MEIEEEHGFEGYETNTEKRKVMMCQVSRCQAGNSENHPCSVCRQGVGFNSFMYVACYRWVDKGCSGISGRLRNNAISIVDVFSIKLC